MDAPEDHWDHTSCWCHPRLENVDGVGLVVKHRDVDPSTIAGRMFFTDNGEFGWESDQPFIHTHP